MWGISPRAYPKSSGKSRTLPALCFPAFRRLRNVYRYPGDDRESPGQVRVRAYERGTRLIVQPNAFVSVTAIVFPPATASSASVRSRLEIPAGSLLSSIRP